MVDIGIALLAVAVGNPTKKRRRVDMPWNKNFIFHCLCGHTTHSMQSYLDHFIDKRHNPERLVRP